MGKNDNQKDKPVAEAKALAPFELDRRLMEEINILRMEGALFCFDPKEAKRRRGKLTLVDVRKHPVTVEIHPDYGQPSVLAYKVLQGIFLKLTEEGCELNEEGKCVYGDTVTFSARELAMLAGRAWSGTTSKQLHQAITQLRRTAIVAQLYDKDTDKWVEADFSVLDKALFAGRGETISRCLVQVNSTIIASLNRRHIAFFNLHRLSTLDTIGLVLYKRVFFHLSNLMHESKRKNELLLRKDYATICKEWLGGLKPLRYKSDILKDQLGRHLDALVATGLIRRYAVEKNAAGDGFNVSFWPGTGFFEDYQHYYLKQQQPRLRFRFRAAAELEEVKTLELVAYFHRQLGRLEHTSFADHETAYAAELLASHNEAEVRDLIDYAIAEAKRTNWAEMLYLGACKRYFDEWKKDRTRTRERERQSKVVQDCPFCNERGFLELREQDTGRLIMHPCPHRVELVTKIEDKYRSYRT